MVKAIIINIKPFKYNINVIIFGYLNGSPPCQRINRVPPGFGPQKGFDRVDKFCRHLICTPSVQWQHTELLALAAATGSTAQRLGQPGLAIIYQTDAFH